MSKIVINRARNTKEHQLITDRTNEIAKEIRDRQNNADLLRISDIANYLQCCTRSAYRYIGARPEHQMPALPHRCGTKKFRTVDVARRLAELEALCG